MKKFIYAITLLCLVQAAFSQLVPPPKNHLSPQEYRKRSGDQVILGSILLVGGTTLAVLGSNATKNATGFDFSGPLIEALGIVVAGGCIPLFISAANNHAKIKAIAMSLKRENALSLQRLTFSNHSYPALSIRINL